MRGRRTSRRGPQSSTASAAADLTIATLLPRHWYRGDTYTLSGGDLATLPNRGSAGGSLSVAAGTLAAPAADSALGNQLSVAFSSTQALQSTLAASAFRYLHDGTGQETWTVFVPTSTSSKVIWATKAFAGAAEVGAGQFSQTGGGIQSIVGNGTASIANAVPTGLSVGVGAYCTHAYKENEALEAIASVGTSYASVAATSQAPSSSDPMAPLRVGSSAGATLTGDLRFAELLSFDRSLTPYERQLVREYIAVRYGIAAPSIDAYDRSVLQLNPSILLRASDAVTGSGLVNTWPAFAGPVTFSPLGDKVAAPSADALMNGQTSIPFTRTANVKPYSVSYPSPTTAVSYVLGWRFAQGVSNQGGVAHTVGGTVNTAQSILKSSNVDIARGSNPASNDAQATLPGFADIAQTAITVAVFEVGQKAKIYHNAKTPVSSPSNIVGLAGDQLLLGGLNNGTTLVLSGAIARMVMFPRALTAAEAATILTQYGAKYGVSIGA